MPAAEDASRIVHGNGGDQAVAGCRAPVPAVFPALPYLPGQGNRDDQDGLRAVRLAVMGSRRASPLGVAAARKRTDRLALAQEHGEAGFGGQALQSVCAEALAGP